LLVFPALILLSARRNDKNARKGLRAVERGMCTPATTLTDKGQVANHPGRNVTIPWDGDVRKCRAACQCRLSSSSKR